MSATEPTPDEARKALEWLKGAASDSQGPAPTQIEERYAQALSRRVRIIERFIRQADALTPTRDTDAYADPSGVDPVDSNHRNRSDPRQYGDDPCGCEPDEDGLFVRDCPGCHLTRATGHCRHDRIQRPCPRCAWMPDYARTPLQAVGFL